MPTYKVLVADRETGRESHLTVEADDRHDAIAKVQDGDTVVGSVVEVETPPPRPGASAASPGAEPIDELLAEVRLLRKKLVWSVAGGVVLGYLGLLGLAAAVFILREIAASAGG